MKKFISKFKDNYVIYGSFSLIILLFLILVGVWVKKGTFSIEPETDSITFDCVDTGIKPGSSAVCNVTANFNTITGLSVNANYNLPEGVSFVSFETSPECTENCFTEFANTENGFAVVNEDGVTGSHLIGRVTFELPDEASPNDVFMIGLNNIEFSDDQYEMHTILDVSDDVRIASNIATLSSLGVDGLTLDTKFSSNVYSYKATAKSDMDKVVIKTVVSDIDSETNVARASVTGDGEVSLHYGTNNFEIRVVAEDGNTTNTYKLSIYREYEFKYDGDGYKYDRGVLYTKNDVDKDTIINSLGVLEEGLSYEFDEDNTKMMIKYTDELLEEIKIVNFGMDYQIIDGVIYVKRGLTISELLGKIKENNVDVKIVDKDDKEVTSGNISEDNKLVVYYDEALLDSYSFKLEYLDIDSSVIVDNENKIFNRLELGTTYGELKEKIDTSGEITIIPYDKSVLTDSSVIRTGDKVKIKFKGNSNEIEYTLSVLGDLTGDGELAVNDVAKLYSNVRGRNKLDMVFMNAGDIINNGSVAVNDVSRLYAYMRGRAETLEVIE